MALSNQNFLDWFKEWGITLGVGLVTGAIFFAIIYAVIRNSPKRWWLWGTAAFAALATILIMLAPIFIEPLLNKYTPMAAGPVRSEILRIAHEQGIPTDNVYVVDASKQIEAHLRERRRASDRPSASRSTTICSTDRTWPGSRR